MPDKKEQNTHLLDRLLSIHPASSPAFSADGKSIFFIMALESAPSVWSIPFSPGKRELCLPEQMTRNQERIQGLWTSPIDSGTFIYACDFGGNENAQFYLHQDGRLEDVCLTPSEPRVMHIFGQWSQDGKSILYSSNKRHAGYFDLYLKALDGEEKMIWKNESYGMGDSLLLSPNGQKVYLSRVQTTFKNDLLEIDVKSEEARDAAPAEDKARYTCLNISRDGNTLYLLTDVGSDFLYIGQYDLKTKNLEKLISLDCDIDFFLLTQDGKNILYTTNRNASSDLYTYDLASGKSKAAPLPPEVRGVIGEISPFIANSGIAISPDAQSVAFTFSTPVCDFNVYVWDLAKDNVYPVTQAPTGGFKPQDFILPAQIEYPSFDGRSIPALLYQPEGEPTRPRPVVVIVHGGPAGQSVQAFNFFHQLLLANGFAVLLPNVRGSNGYGKTYTLLDEVEKRMVPVADLAYAAKWLQSRPEFDSQRLAVYGASYGGFMVLASMTHDPDLWAVGIDVVGIGNFVTFLENTSEYRRAHREAEYGSLAHDRAFMERIAPMNHLDKIKAPLMVIHGANDPRVPLSESDQLVNALEERNIPVEKLVFDDEGHGIVKDKNKRVAYPAMLDFLLKHLAS